MVSMSCSQYSLVLNQCWDLRPKWSDGFEIFVMLKLQTFLCSFTVCYLLGKISTFWVDITAKRLRFQSMPFFISKLSVK